MKHVIRNTSSQSTRCRIPYSIVGVSIALLIGGVLQPWSMAQSTPPDVSTPMIQSEPAQEDPAVEPFSWDVQLEALQPDHPEDYFRLGEMALDIEKDELASRLFVLAAHLDGAQFGQSACLALAQLARDNREHGQAREFLAIARMFPSTVDAPSITLDALNTPEDEYRQAGSLVASMLGFYRTGFGARARKMLDRDPLAPQLLREYTGGIGDVDHIQSYCKDHIRCETCGNDMIIELPHAIPSPRDRNRDNPEVVNPEDQFQRCPEAASYRPAVAPDRLRHMLNVESALAGGRSATWGAQLLLDEGTPRPILDPVFLGRILKVDPARTVYRSGKWISPNDEEGG